MAAVIGIEIEKNRYKSNHMLWQGRRESDNVEDRRGDSDDGGGGGGGGFGGRHIGIGSIVIALVASYFFGVNPMTVLSLLSGGAAPVP